MKNLIIISSVINTTNKALSYTNTRSVYSMLERYNQTIKSIESCDKVENNEILFIETSNIDGYMEETIKTMVNYYINFSDNSKIQEIIDGPLKGKAEATQLWNGIREVNIDNYDNIFKLSGRYWFSEEFDYLNYKNENNVFVEGPNKNALGTVMYKIGKPYFDQYIKCLDFCKRSNGMLEKDFINFFRNNYVTYPKIGIEGHVSVDGKLINW